MTLTQYTWAFITVLNLIVWLIAMKNNLRAMQTQRDTRRLLKEVDASVSQNEEMLKISYPEAYAEYLKWKESRP